MFYFEEVIKLKMKTFLRNLSIPFSDARIEEKFLKKRDKSVLSFLKIFLFVGIVTFLFGLVQLCIGGVSWEYRIIRAVNDFIRLVFFLIIFAFAYHNYTWVKRRAGLIALIGLYVSITEEYTYKGQPNQLIMRYSSFSLDRKSVV